MSSSPTPELEQLADRCDRIQQQINAIKGRRDYITRARRIGLRQDLREAREQFRRACIDLQIGLMAGFPWERSDPR